MRILYCTTGLAVGGAEAQVVELACEMKKRGHEVRVVSMLPVTTAWPKLLNAEIRVDTLGMQRGVPSPIGFVRLVRLWNQFLPDVVHAHMYHANIVTRLARLFCRKAAVISTAHSIDEGGGVRTLLYRVTDNLADVTTNVCEIGVEAYARRGAVSRARLRYVPNGIDFRQLRSMARDRLTARSEIGWSDFEFVWLAAGRLVEAKDYSTLIQACRLVKDVVSCRWRLAIAGDGHLRNTIVAQIKGLGLSDRIILLGTRSDIGTLMSAADAFAMSSAWEGLPIVLLEAAAFELPAIATSVGGIPEVISHGLTGLLAPARSPRAFADAMIHMMNLSFSNRQEMATRSAQYAKSRYDMNIVAGLWERIYISH